MKKGLFRRPSDRETKAYLRNARGIAAFRP